MRFNSPRTISFFIALLVAIVATVLIFVSSLFVNIDISLYYYLAIFIILLLSMFLIISFSIENFIYDRIKLIYRSAQIFQSKKELSEMNLDMRTDVLGKVSEEIAKRMLEQHKTIDQLQEREGFRREFIGNLAHELKTPIFSIQGYILTLLEGGIDDKEVNKLFLQKAANGVDRVTNLLDDLDSISKLESGHYNIEKTRFNFTKQILQISEDLENRAQKKKINIEVQKKDKKELWVFADQNKIGQVLTNLINNAIKYGQKGGFIKVSYHIHGQKVLIEIEDNGIGITEQDASRIFERFYRVEKSRSRQKGGTGLGLAIAKHIIDSHNETLSVRSSLGEGSVFSFSLPISGKE